SERGVIASLTAHRPADGKLPEVVRAGDAEGPLLNSQGADEGENLVFEAGEEIARGLPDLLAFRLVDRRAVLRQIKIGDVSLDGPRHLISLRHYLAATLVAQRLMVVGAERTILGGINEASK